MDKETIEPKIISPSEIMGKRKQLKLFALLLGSILILLFLLIVNWSSQTTHQNTESISKTAPVYDVSRQVEDKSYWMYKSEQVLKAQAKMQEDLQKKVEALEDKLLDPGKAITSGDLDEQAKVIRALEDRVAQLESTPEHDEAVAKDPNESLKQQWARSSGAKFQNQGAESKGNNQALEFSSGMMDHLNHTKIFSEKLILAPKIEDPKSKIPHINHYIPVGTFARAVLLNGIDVSVGISAQQNPQPVLLRLIDKGNLPNGAVGDMRDCRIIAAAHGDYSSERALLRIEKLSCVQKDDSIIETDVGGFVVGIDGKAGIRGPMITRDGELLTQGFISGLFSGLGKAVSAATGTSSVSPFGAVNTIQGKEVMKKAAGEGTGSAFELLSRYAIKRLEQLQPIIQIPANREVDIVFHTGSQFGEKKERIKEKHAKEPEDEFKIGDFTGG